MTPVLLFRMERCSALLDEVERIAATQTLAAEYADALEVMAYEGEAACIYHLLQSTAEKWGRSSWWGIG